MTIPAESLHHGPFLARYRVWLFAFLVSFLTSFVLVTPFFWLGNASGHDFQFHAQSWLDAAGQWKEGIIYPRWAEWANYGFGEPRFIFYPPFSWMLGAALSFVAPWNAVPAVFIVLVQTFAGLSAFALVRRLIPERDALFSAAVYAANPYALLVIYMRSDFAEQLAIAFFPLLILAALQIGKIVETRLSARFAILFFGVLFAAVWLSNAPAAVLATYSSALLFAGAALAGKSWRPLAHGAASLALGFGLAGFYLVPAVFEQRWVNISQALAFGLPPSQNFLYTEIDDPEHTFFNWIASTLAVMLICLTGIAAIAARKKTSSGSSALKDSSWRSLLLLAAVASFLMLRFTAILWNLLPELRFVQFPWRWMSVLAVPFAIFLGAAMVRHRWIWLAIVFATIGGTGVFLVQNGWWDTEDIPVLRQAIASGTGFEGTDEYDPLGDDHTNVPMKAPDAALLSDNAVSGASASASIHIDVWTAEDKELRVNLQAPARLGLRLLDYPAWRVEVNGQAVVPEWGDDFSQMIVPMPSGESRIRAHFTRTRDRWFGGLLSLLSGAAALFLMRRRIP